MVKMKNRKGFSLLELVAVIAIIGIIAGAVMLNAQRFTHPARVNTWRTSMNSLKNALILYSTTSRGGGAFPEPPTDPVDISKWLMSSGALYYLNKPIRNPFKGGITVTVCGASGTLTPVDQATASDCVIQYTTETFKDPINYLTINNGRFTITYTIGTGEESITESITVP